MSKDNRKHGPIDQRKYRKIACKIKWIDREYHVQDKDDVTDKEVKIYCDTNQSPELTFCGPHPRPHGKRGLSKHYHLLFEPKIDNGVCAIHRIPWDCVVCT